MNDDNTTELGTDQIPETVENQDTEYQDNDDLIQLTAEEYQELLAERDRAEKAEKEAAKMKKLFSNAREHSKQSQNITKTNNTPTREEVILFAKGYSIEDVEYINKIASLEGVSPIEAVDTDLFKAFQVRKEEQQRAVKAQVGVSRRGSTYVPPKTFQTAKTKDDHMELWKKAIGE